MDRNKGWFLLILVLSVALTVVYIHQRHLLMRYVEYQRSAAALSQSEQLCADLTEQLAASREHAIDLGSDLTEIEAAIRRSKDLVREGETVFRIEPAPREP